MATSTHGTVYKSKAYKQRNNSISYMAWVVVTTFMIGAVGVAALGWGLAIRLEWIEIPKVPWSSLQIGSLGLLYFAGTLINGYKPKRPSHKESVRHAHRQDSVRRDATRRP
jgi:hypothetical protein